MNVNANDMDYGPRLAWLTNHQQELIALLGDAGWKRGWWPANDSWLRQFARFDPHRTPYCVLLFESVGEIQHFCSVEVHWQAPSVASEDEICLPYPPLGYLKLVRFPRDAALSTLSEVIREAIVVRIVRYRPQLRCTLQVGNGRGEPYSFAKVLPDDHGGAIHEAGVLLWNAVVRGELGFHVAEPQRWDAGKRCLWHAEVPGESAQSRLFNAEGARIAHRMGRALATLSNSSVRFDAVFDAAWQLERTTGYLRELAARLPQESMTIDALVLELERLHTRLEPAPLRPLHGAPHPHQWLIADNTFSLLDFDRSGRGDVELDVATFVAEVDFVSPKSCDIAGINAKFITGFESVAGPLDPMRFGLYRAHKHVAKVLRLARSVRVDGAAKAAALLANIRTNLDEMCAKGTAKTWALVSGWKRHLGVLATTILAQVDSVTVEAYLYLECLL